jgi:hypothetical protein
MITLAALIVAAALGGGALGVVIGWAMERFDARRGEPDGANTCVPRCTCRQDAKLAQRSPQGRAASSDRPRSRPELTSPATTPRRPPPCRLGTADRPEGEERS